MRKHTRRTDTLWNSLAALAMILSYIGPLGAPLGQAHAAPLRQLQIPARNSRAGLCWVNGLGYPDSDTRYAHAFNSGATWTRWTLDWNEIEPNADGNFDWTAAEAVIGGDYTHLLYTDTDGNHAPSPGDVLLYRVTLENNGIAPATGVTFDDTPDPNTALLTGARLAIRHSPFADLLTRPTGGA